MNKCSRCELFTTAEVGAPCYVVLPDGGRCHGVIRPTHSHLVDASLPPHGQGAGLLNPPPYGGRLAPSQSEINQGLVDAIRILTDRLEKIEDTLGIIESRTRSQIRSNPNDPVNSRDA